MYASHISGVGLPKCIVRVVSQVPSRYWPPESLPEGKMTRNHEYSMTTYLRYGVSREMTRALPFLGE